MGEKNSFCPGDFIQQVQVENERKIIARLLNSKKSLNPQRTNDPLFTKVYVGWEEQFTKKRKRRNKTEISLNNKPRYFKQNNINEQLDDQTSTNRVLHSQSVQLPKLSKSLTKNKNNALNGHGRVSDFAKYQHTIEENSTTSQTRVHQNKANLMKQKLMKVVEKVYQGKKAKKSQQKDIQRPRVCQKSAIFKKIKLQHLKKPQNTVQKNKRAWSKIDILKLETCFVKLLKNKKDFDDQQLKISQIKDLSSFQKINVPKRQKVPQFIRQYKSLNPNLDIDQLIKSKNFQIIIDQGSLYFGQMQNGKKAKLGVYISKNYKFEGFWKKDQKYQGYEVTPQGYYIGRFKEGVRNGQGEFIWFNGQNYEGEWKNGFKHGSGIWRSGKGDSYLGQWQNGKVQGYGVHITASGQKYQGQFKDFLKSGKGKQIFPNGDVYDGQYRLGKPQGNGKYTWKNHIYYEGQFAEGFRHGKGSLTAQNYIKFIGSFIGQKPNGKGEIEYQNGDIFKGLFLQGQKHGKGILKLKNEHKIISGRWKHNQLEDQTQQINNKQ